MEETPVGTVSNLINDVGLQVNVERPRHVLAGGGLREKGTEAIIMGRRRALQKATVGLGRPSDWNPKTGMEGTHAETMLNSVQLPCKAITLYISLCAYKKEGATQVTR